MVDPDAPSRQNPSKKFWRHWLVIDLPVSFKIYYLKTGD